jgi:hypothetical protein
MTAVRVPCAGTNAAGEPCKSTFVQKDGFCTAHGPDGLNAMRERGRKGARALRTPGLKTGELGPLASHADAERWLQVIVTAVGESRLTHNSGSAMFRGIDTWLRAQDASKVERIMNELRGCVEDYLGTGRNAGNKEALADGVLAAFERRGARSLRVVR